MGPGNSLARGPYCFILRPHKACRRWLLLALLSGLLSAEAGPGCCATRPPRPQTRGLHAFVLGASRGRLKGPWKRRAADVSRAILSESRLRGLDPVMLMAVIANESSFNPAAIGSHGEVGLMQIRPGTAEWIARIKKLPYKGRRTLLDPVQNIRLGAAYMGLLRQRYGRDCRLILAAYNMGSASLERALARRRSVNSYPCRVLKRYAGLRAELRELRSGLRSRV